MATNARLERRGEWGSRRINGAALERVGLEEFRRRESKLSEKQPIDDFYFLV